jgi:RHS repeat-associated protein
MRWCEDQQVDYVFGLAITYSYDSRSQRSAMVDPWGGRFTYAFDAAGQITSLTNPDNRTTLFYQDHTRRSGLRHGNNARVSYTYDDAGRMIGVNNMNSAGTAFNRFTYTFDGVGNRTRVLEFDGSRVTWTYDAADQLLQERGTPLGYVNSHVYDAVGNRTDWTDLAQLWQTTLTFDAANQVKLEQGSFPYTYDAAGNLNKVDWSGSLYTLTWDAENRLTSYHDPFGYGLETYTYDGDGRRVGRQPAGHRYFWDEENLLLMGDSGWSPIYRFTYEQALYGNLLSEALWFIGGFNTQRFYHFDGLGSTVRLTQANGTTIGNNMFYQGFGQPMTQGDQITPYRWLGQIGYELQMPPLGGWVATYYDYANYYVRQRYYDRWAARWSSRDPLMDDLLGNRYRYSKNVPTLFTDPSGLLAPIIILELAICAEDLVATAIFTESIRQIYRS